jgi:hypothetical protein
MVNYAQSKIYRIVCNKTNQNYIGSCTTKLSTRLSVHKQQLQNGRCCSSYEVLKGGDFQIFLIEDFPCERREQLTARERYWVENTPNCVNCNVPGRGKKEWYEENRERLIANQIEWNNAHKEQLGTYQRKYRQKLKTAIALTEAQLEDQEVLFEEIYPEQSNSACGRL